MMVRLLIASVMVLMAGNAHADYKNNDMYEICKAWERQGFDYTLQGESCSGYFFGIGDASQSMCAIIKSQNPPGEILRVLQKVFATGLTDFDLEAAVKHYIKTVEQDPKLKKQSAAYTVIQSIQTVNPCY